MELLEFLQPKGKDIVVERPRRSSKKLIEFHVAAGCIAVIDGDGTAHVSSGFALDAHKPPVDADIQPATVSSAIQRLVAARVAPAIQSKQDGSDECHERALSGFIRA